MSFELESRISGKLVKNSVRIENLSMQNILLSKGFGQKSQKEFFLNSYESLYLVYTKRLKILKGKKIAKHVSAMVVPGSGLVKQQAEQEKIDQIFKEAGFEWREPGCSMCLAMNADKLNPKERCASTSNRNFEGRQGRGGRTHLVSPAMAAAAAIDGYLTDVRKFSN